MTHIYRIALSVPEAAVDIFAAALEPLVASVAWRTAEGKIKAEVLGFNENPPAAAAIQGQLLYVLTSRVVNRVPREAQRDHAPRLRRRGQVALRHLEQVGYLRVLTF